MVEKTLRVGVVATGSPINKDVEREILALIAGEWSVDQIDVSFAPQCFEREGHFAGSDELRTAAFLDVANNPEFDALWFARGGYGACRLIEYLVPELNNHARDKWYLGYSDAGFILGALYNMGFPRIAHGPMPQDITRENGNLAVMRALSFLKDPSSEEVESTVTSGVKCAAFNITILSHMIGTPYLPDLTDHIVMLEDLSETAESIDRSLQSILCSPALAGISGIKLGRCPIDPPKASKEGFLPNAAEVGFDGDIQEMVEYWCERSGTAFLGSANIGHDHNNQIVPFGSFPSIG
jgi:muramoyltetrapeptide carboxypeptidase